MATVSKDYVYGNQEFGQDLYWPAVNDMYDMLKINIFEYVPISKSGVGSGSLNSLSNIQDLTTRNPTGTGAAANSVQKSSLSTVLLPVPNDITYADQLKWESEDLGILGKMAPALAGSALSGATDLGSKLSQLASGGTPEFILGKIKEVAGFSPQSLTQGMAGKILNPYAEQIFKGIGMREFNFSWKLVPRNATEQSRIHRIIQALRYYSLPNYSSSAGIVEGATGVAEETNKLSDRWLTVPNIFELNWMQAGVAENRIQSLPKIKPCVLKSITVNYTPDNVWATHISTSSKGLSGPAPVAYELSLNFSETEIITAKDVVSTGNGGF